MEVVIWQRRHCFPANQKILNIRLQYRIKAKKYMKTVVAFANGRGGKIVFGIEDKTLEVVGMDEDSIYKTMDDITNAISDSCEPVISRMWRCRQLRIRQ